MSDFVYFDDEAKVVHYDDRPVEIVLRDGRSLFIHQGDLLDDQLNSLDISMLVFSPNEEYANFVPNTDEEDDR